MKSSDEARTLEELLADMPTNWGRWGSQDEIGCINFLGGSEVLRAIKSVKSGKVFTLGVPIGSPKGDPVWPGKTGAVKCMTRDKGVFLSGKAQPHPGGYEDADDFISMYLHATTHFDALGHVWYGDKLWNGYDSRTTMGGMEKAGILPIAEHGIVGSGVLLDIARFRGKDSLQAGETIGLKDLEGCAREEGLEIQKHDILIIRTGWLNVFYEKGPQAFYGDSLNEPGLTYSKELVAWLYRKEIPVLGTDTLANEATTDPVSGLQIPLHSALLRNLGVTLNEILWLENLAEDCANDRQYRFMFAAAPLKVCGGTGAPANPLVIK